MLKKSIARLITGNVAAVLLGGALVSAHSAPSGVAAWVSKASKTGDASSELSVTIAVHMALRNTDGMKQLVAAVSSPSSKLYGHYLSTEQFAAQFAPAEADVSAVKALLENAGMKEVTVGPHGVYVSAVASVAQLRATFHVSQSLYSYAGKTLRANKEEPTLPKALMSKITYVQGLDDTTSLRTPYHKSVSQDTLVAPRAAAAAAAPAAVTPPPVAANNPSPYCNTYFGGNQLKATLTTAAGIYGASIPWLNCGYTPQQIQAAYGLNKVSYDGTGVTVAIIDAYASPTLMADGNRYAANHKLPKLTSANFTQMIPAGIYSVSPTETCGPYGWWTEESLDLSAVHGAAPGAKIVYVGSRDCDTSLDIALYKTIYNHVADVVTNSYGFNSEAIAPGMQMTYDQAFIAAGLLGTTVLFSSGDDGDLSQLNGAASGAWPATSAYVTGVGGTSLLLRDANGDKSEFGWGTYRDYLANATVNSSKLVTTSGLTTTSYNGTTFDAFAFYSGSGGGISLLETQPSWQKGVVPAALATTLNFANGYTDPLPAPQRVSPDVAMVADPYTGYLYGESFTIAGDPNLDHGCTPTSATVEYCEEAEGGTSLASPLMAGVIAVVNQKRAASGTPLVGFANPMLYAGGSGGTGGSSFTSSALNEVAAPTVPVSVLRGYANNLESVRVVTVNSVPLVITTVPFPIQPCAVAICYGIDDVFNFTSSSNGTPPTPAGYNDVTGLGVPYLPKLITEE